MAAPPLLSLTDIRLGFGGAPLFEGVSLAIGDGDRVALVGRNGSGKSTLLKILAGIVEPDSGERWTQPGARIGYLAQDPGFAGFATLAEAVAAELPEEERYKAEMAMDGLGLDGGLDPAQASGGERRRAALARALADDPDLLLLDEPTNHLDIAAIEWLEAHLAETRKGFVLISHDRTFLSRLTRATLWLDRGEARRLEQGFGAFEEWRDTVFEAEELERAKLDAKIRREEHWIIHGVSGRRKRNMRRVAELADLRQRRREMRGVANAGAPGFDDRASSGKLVIEAKDIAKRFGAREILKPFSTRILRGDRVAVVGPNGVGKTTLVNMLVGALAPDQGAVRVGANVEIAVFDQARAQLDPDKSLWETLTEDELLGARGSNDQIMVHGRPKHVVGYLKEFLFDDRQARGPVSMLSGGERARLLLARLMARPCNLLVLDEPTNDLDLETLDLLQEQLDQFEGALLLVSHDRDFVDRIATSTIAMEGDGRAIEYAGGWSDYQAQRGPREDAPAAAKPATKPVAAPKRRGAPKRKLSFNQAHRLKQLPDEISRFETEIAKLEALLADPGLYARDPNKFQQATAVLADRQAKRAAAEEEWLELEALREEIEGG